MPAVPKLAAVAPLATPATAPLLLTPLQVDDLIALKLGEVCAGITDWKLPVTVRGVLGDLPPARYSGGKLYRVPLVDHAAPASVTYLDVREAILEQAEAAPGDHVRAVGIIIPNLFKGVVSFRLDVIALELEAAPPAQQARETPNAISALRRLALTRQAFPNQPAPSITLIHSAASDARVADDFLGALGPGQAGVAVQRVPVSMHDPAAIAAAIGQAGGDIVALVRGGGDAAAFAVFEDPRVLDALAKCRSYQVLGLGHTADRTLAELVADHAAATPTAAGEHVRRGVEGAQKARSEGGRVQEMHERLIANELQLADAIQQVTLLGSQRTEAQFGEPLPSPAQKASPGWVWAAVAAGAAAVGAVALHWL